MNTKMIEELRQKVEKNRLAHDQIVKQKEALAKELSSLKAAAETAEDMDSYTAIKRNIRETEDKIDFLSRQIEKPIYASEADAVSAWNKYASGYNKELSDALKDVEKARKILAEAFTAAIKLQNEAMLMREEVAALAGIKADHNDFTSRERFPAFNMDYIPCQPHVIKAAPGTTLPEISYLISSKMWPDRYASGDNFTGPVQDVNRITNYHMPVKDLRL